jgi:hypothetical protein
MARPAGSRFETHLPYFRKEKVGAFCWGFVAGKSQTIYPWDSWQKKYKAEPKVWFHDILRPDGTPYDKNEVKQIKEQTSKRIDVRLRFSVEEIDPLKPGDSFVECIVRNGSDMAVAVPVTYSGGWSSDLLLHGTPVFGKEVFGLHHEMKLVYWAGELKKETKLLKPGEELTVFKDTLNAVLVLDRTKDKPLKPKEPRYYWSWMA